MPSRLAKSAFLDSPFLRPEVAAHTPPEEILDVQAAELVQSLNREAAAARRRTAMLKRKRERDEKDANRWSRI